MESCWPSWEGSELIEFQLFSRLVWAFGPFFGPWSEITAAAIIMLLFARSAGVRALSTSSHGGATAVKLRDGLVVVRNALTLDEQLRLAECATELGLAAPPGGLFDAEGMPNSRPYRGRVFSSIRDWPAFASEWCNRSLDEGIAVDPTLPPMDATHILLLAYMSSEGVGWHRDIYENDGAKDKPIVTFNLGNACEFVFKDDHTTPKTYVELASGDVLLFGGKCRYAMHKVSRVVERTCPEKLMPTLTRILERRKQTGSPDGADIGDSVRLSLTFRDAPSVVGRESEFASFKVDEHFDKDANFRWRPDKNSQVPAQPGQDGKR